MGLPLHQIEPTWNGLSRYVRGAARQLRTGIEAVSRVVLVSIAALVDPLLWLLFFVGSFLDTVKRVVGCAACSNFGIFAL